MEHEQDSKWGTMAKELHDVKQQLEVLTTNGKKSDEVSNATASREADDIATHPEIVKLQKALEAAQQDIDKLQSKNESDGMKSESGSMDITMVVAEVKEMQNTFNKLKEDEKAGEKVQAQDDTTSTEGKEHQASTDNKLEKLEKQMLELQTRWALEGGEVSGEKSNSGKPTGVQQLLESTVKSQLATLGRDLETKFEQKIKEQTDKVVEAEKHRLERVENFEKDQAKKWKDWSEAHDKKQEEWQTNFFEKMRDLYLTTTGKGEDKKGTSEDAKGLKHTSEKEHSHHRRMSVNELETSAPPPTKIQKLMSPPNNTVGLERMERMESAEAMTGSRDEVEEMDGVEVVHAWNEHTSVAAENPEDARSGAGAGARLAANDETSESHKNGQKQKRREEAGQEGVEREEKEEYSEMNSKDVSDELKMNPSAKGVTGEEL